MALNPLYVVQSSLQDLFRDKSTGLPLSGGQIFFYKDNQRNSPKTVYQLSGAPPNYNYTALPNPMTLNSIGTSSSNAADDVVIYWYPYDDFGNLETYYVVVEDANGLPQFTRENWPYPNVGNAGGSAGGTATGDFNNELSNSQFVDVFFNPTNGITFIYSGNGTTDFPIGPDWTLRVVHTGAGSATVTRTANIGNSGIPSNPPYSLNFTAGANITQFRLFQRLTNNPNIWSPQVAGVKGFLAGSIMLGAGTEVIMQYEPSGMGTAQLILHQNNLTGLPAVFNNTIQLAQADNTNNSNVGYVDIAIYLPVVGNSSISSVQVLGLDTDLINVPYEQQPVNRQKDYLFHYYNPLLQYKPIPSFLAGWDFALNPAQIWGDSRAAQAIGANKSEYKWDQTIMFQSADSCAGVSRGANGGLVITCVNPGQVAIIQYLDKIEARKLLSDKMAVHISAFTSRVAGLGGTVSLWCTDDLDLPNVNAGTNNSAVSAIDVTGFPTMGNGTWTQVPRSNLGNALFTISQQSATNDESADINFNGWDMQNAALTNAANYFAIVIGFAPCVGADTITVNSVGLCAGSIATRPAPKTLDEALRDCERWYEKSYQPSDIPGTAITTFNSLSASMNSTVPFGGGFQCFLLESPFTIKYRTLKRAPRVQGFPTVTIYPTSAATVGNVSIYTVISAVVALNGLDPITTWGNAFIGDKFATFTPVTNNGARQANGFNATTPVLFYARFHYVADARLGIVN